MPRLNLFVSLGILSLLLATVWGGCTSPEQKADSQTASVVSLDDPHSFARPQEAAVTHADLDMKVDFENETITGIATLTLKRTPDAKYVYLDTKDMDILAIKRSGPDQPAEDAPYEMGEKDEILGEALIIALGPNTNQVQIAYRTHADAEALQWLPARLTAGKTMGYLLTQSQAINARTWVPIQDGPGMRFTYTAKVKVPPGMMALMSAENPTEKSSDGIYTFKMEQPIPAYLLALAVGDIGFQSLGPRSGVYADPSMLEKSAYEFADLEKMMQLAEGLYGPYRWDRYDIVVLPSSFPFGGMENPRLTFATPTILAGDRSLVSLVAHELAHSWSGNLVTNANWNDFWLNEGFTVYFEMRIMEELEGRTYSEMLSQLSYQDLLSEVQTMGPTSRETWLKLDLKGQNPDDGVTSIAYDKGYYFLRLVEQTVGREDFDAFLRGYFEKHAFETMTTEAFLVTLKNDLLKNDPDMLAQIDIERWVYGPGVPENVPKPVSERFAQVDAVQTQWMDGTPINTETAKAWSTHEWLHFIRNLPPQTTEAQFVELDRQFGLTQSSNCEIQCAWYTQALRHTYEPAYPAVKSFLTSVGRRKFLTPLYEQMLQNEKREAGSKGGMALAKDIYTEARPTYHPISYNTIDKLLGWETPTE